MDPAAGDAIRPILHIVDTIYDAATDVGKWDGVLRTICDTFGAFGGNLLHLNMEDGTHLLQLFHGFEFPPARMEALIAQFVDLRHDDPRIQTALRYPGKPLSCRLAIPEAELHRSRVYRELLRPLNVEYTLFVQLTDQRGALTGLALFRRPGEAPWVQEDCDRLGLLIPHLRRGVGLLQRFTKSDRQVRLSHAVLDSIGIGIIFCGPDGEVEFLNRTARALIDAADGLALMSQKLRLWRTVDQAMLARSLAATAASGRHTAFAIERPSAARPYHCLISRVTLAEQSFDHAGPTLAIYLSDPDAPVETSSELLGRLYGLTPMEAKVAEQIVRGRTLAEAASDLAIERSTARSHLKAIFAKTNTHHQREFVRQVLSNPFWASAARDFD